MPTYDYAISTDTASGQVKPDLLRTEVEAAALGATLSRLSVRVHGPDSLRLEFDGAVDEPTLAGVVAAHDPNALTQKKRAKSAAIDVRSQELISQGFAFAGKTFSLSSYSQTNLLGLDQLRDDPALVYPVKYNTIDDADAYEIPDSATMHSFFLTAVGTYRGHLDSGTALKDQVRAATTQAELDAVVDDR